MENLLTIGEFASAARLSQRALRLYGANGLLPPSWVDPASGYRYYRPAQLRTATVIALLRRCGMGLDEIRAFLLAPSVQRLDDFAQREAAEFAQRQRVLHHLRRIMEEELVYDVSTRTVAGQPYVSRSARVYVRDLEPFICSTFRELGAAFEPGTAPPFVIYHGPVNADEDGPVEVCVPAADGPQRLPAGEVAYTSISGDQCAFPQILGAYEAVYGWAASNGREPAGPPREIYLGGDGEVERLEIALPLS